MSPETTTPASPELRPAPGRETPFPEMALTTDRNALPNVLNWASESPRPPVNGRVDIVSYGEALGTGTVVGYFHNAGELGCKVELDSVPEWLQEMLPEGTRIAHFYGQNITRLDQGDEPDEAPGLVDAGVRDVPVMKEEQPLTVPAPTAEDTADDVATDDDEAGEPGPLLDDDSDDDHLGDEQLELN